MKCRYPAGGAAAALLSVLVLVVATAPVSAGTFDNRPKLLVHLKTTTTKNACAWGDLADCSQAVTAGQLATASGPFYYAYILVATGPLRGVELGGNGLGVGGAQLGVRYDESPGAGLHVFGWHLCATLEFPSTGWPASGGGNLITWDTTTACQRGDVAVAGYFYCGAYTSDELEITPRPVDGLAKVADCNALETTLSADLELGCAMFNPFGSNGCNPCTHPCFVTPVRPTSWTSIKTLVR